MEKDDLSELIERIFYYGRAYKSIGRKPPFFRLTPYEHDLFVNYLIKTIPGFRYHALGALPTYMDIDFELVGKPVLFNGKHIRQDKWNMDIGENHEI